MLTKRSLRFVPLALLLASCGGKGINTYDLGTPATQQADAYVEAESPKAIRGTKRVVIPYFQIEFVQQSAASRTAGKESTATLTGVTANQFQAITNDFYDAVVSELKASGIDVVPTEQMVTTAEFKTLSSHGFKPSPDTVEHQDNISKFYAPHGMQVYYLPGDERFAGVATGKKSKGLGAGLSAFAGVMKGTYGGEAYKYVEEEVALSKALGAEVLRARVVVDFADVEATGSGSNEQVKTAIRISFAAKDSFYRFNGAEGEGGFFLKQPLISGDGFAEKKDTGHNASGGKVWEAAANGGAYEASVRKHLDAFRSMMMAKVKSSI